jgi:hypothetical protein
MSAASRMRSMPGSMPGSTSTSMSLVKSMLKSVLRMLVVVIGMAMLPTAGIGAAIAAGTHAAPAWLEAELPKARLAGSGNFRYFGMNIYDADFWVGQNGYRSSAPTAEKFALDLRYARALVGKRIASSSADEMKKLGLGTPEQRAVWLAKMEALFPDVQEGTRITGLYLPQHGARFYRDGKLLGEIADPEFGVAFFAIWLDPKTTAGKLREALLADAAPR